MPVTKEMTITYVGVHSETRDSIIITFVRDKFGLELWSTGSNLGTSERIMTFNDEEFGNAT